MLCSCAKKPLVSSVVQVDSVTHTQILAHYFTHKDSTIQISKDSSVIILTFSDTAKVHVDLNLGTIDGNVISATIINKKKNTLNRVVKIDSSVVSTIKYSNVKVRSKTVQKQQVNYTLISIGIASIVALIIFLILIVSKVINFTRK
jgi:hypothetical protein